MNQTLGLNSNFWLLIIGALSVYYAFVIWKFFGPSIASSIQSGRAKMGAPEKKISYEELISSLSIQRKLLDRRFGDLDEYEKGLLSRSPFKELITGAE